MLRDEDKGKAKAPKLRAKAGEARALVPCALELARKYLDPVISQEEAMLHAAEALNSMYTCLSSAAWDQAVFRDAAQSDKDIYCWLGNWRRSLKKTRYSE